MIYVLKNGYFLESISKWNLIVIRNCLAEELILCDSASHFVVRHLICSVWQILEYIETCIEVWVQDYHYIFRQLKSYFSFLFFQFFLFLESLKKFFDVPSRIIYIDPKTSCSAPLATLSNVLLTTKSIKRLKVTIEPHREKFLLVAIFNTTTLRSSHANFIPINNSK